MKNAAVNLRSMPTSLRRVLTLLVVLAVVLMALPLQANAQEDTMTSTTGDDFAGEVDWATASEDEASATSDESETSEANSDEFSEEELGEEPVLSEEMLEPFDDLAEALWTDEPMPEDAHEWVDPVPGVEEIDPVGGTTFGTPSLRSAFRSLALASDSYNATPSPGVTNFWAHMERVDNPPIVQKCGLNVALVFDVSNSIGQSGLTSSKAAGRTVVNTLRGAAGTKLGIFNFETYANPMEYSLDMETQTQRALNTINSLRIAPNGVGGTNWQSGLEQVNNSPQDYDVVYFITDGVPTTNKTQSPGTDIGYIPHNNDIAEAIKQANTLKRGGTRLEVLAVGMDGTRQAVLKDNVSRVPGGRLGDLGNWDWNYDTRRYELNTNSPSFRYNQLGNDYQIDNALSNGALIEYSTWKALAGADVTAQWTGIGSWVGSYLIPRYNLNQPTGRQISLSLTSDVTDVSNYDELENQLKRMLPAPCLANVVVEKSVVDQFSNTANNVTAKDWEFEFGTLPSGFTYQTGYQPKVKTDSNGRAEWRFNTSTPTENGMVDITELVKANVDSQLQKVVCTDRQDAEIPVEVNGQKFSIKLTAGQTYTCKVVNQIPGFEVSKRAAADQNPDVAGDQPVVGIKADGSFTAYYHIDVQNLSKSQNTLTKPVIDTLVYPQGFTANEVIFTLNGSRVTATYRNGSYEIPVSALGRFNASQTKTINVEVRGTANAAARQSLDNGSYDACEATDGSKTGGLLNKVSMEGDKDKTNNEACVDVTVLDILLKLLKVDHNNVNQALTGAEFALYTAINGQIGEKVTDFTVGGADGSYETRIAIGGEYFVVETKAPDGYSLLPAPVHIRVDTAADGSLSLKVLNPNQAFSAESKKSDDSKYVILQVADLQSGALPQSGGMGVVPFAVAALLILGFGAFMLRRRM